MNIAIISPRIYPCSLGGVEVANYYHIRELARRGHKVWVLTNCGHDWKNRNISAVKLSRRILLSPNLSTNFHLFLELMRLKKKIDVFHVPYTSNSPLSYPILLAKKLFGIRYIITIHGGGMHPWKPKILHKFFFKNASTIVAVSETIKKEYERRSGRKIKVILPLIPFRESKISKENLKNKYGFKNDVKIILSLGAIKKIKGSDILLYAFLGLGKTFIDNNNLRLVYVGGGPLRNILEEKAKERKFGEYVEFIGNVPHQKVRDFYSLADIYIISSLFEGTPLALLEAMFNGLPIIGTDVNGINNLIKHGKNGLLFEKQNSKDLMEKIKELVDNSNLCDELGKAAKNDYLTSYNFEYTISEYIELFAKIA